MEERVVELLEKALNDGYILYTDFITPNIYKKYNEKYKDLKIFTYGKLRKMLAFVPKFQEEYIDFPVTLVKIEVNNKFRVYSNKDFLGSIMSLNIDRKYIGDIFVKDNTAYVNVSNKVLDILLSLDRIGKNMCNCEIVNEKLDLDFNFKELSYTVASIRLDNIVSAICNISRNSAKEYIEKGLCMIDYKEELNIAKEIKEESIISLKSYGRYIYCGIQKESKKGKQFIKIKKYID